MKILAVVDPLASKIPSTIYQTLTPIVEVGRQGAVQEEFLSCCIDRRMRVTLVNWERDSAEGRVTLTVRIRHRGTPDLQTLAERAAGIEGVVETQIRL